MFHHFVKTDAASVGPFSDVEIKELAFAGLLKPESNIATSPEGPWLTAQSIELFSFQRLPVPHPQGTIVPHFEVQGLPAAFRGPFKLRELFGFAARGMLPPDALIKSDDREEWRPVQQFSTLMLCLNGDLVRLGANSQLVLRTTGNPEKVNLAHTSAPIEFAQQAVLKRANLVEEKVPSPVIVDDGYEAEQAAIQAATAKAIAQSKASSNTKSSANATILASAETDAVGQSPPGDSKLDKIREFLGSELTISDLVHPSQWSRRVTLFVIASLSLVVCAAAFAYISKPPNPSDRVEGTWIGENSQSTTESQSAFGISLSEDGKCKVFSSNGPSWQGAYFYSEKHGLSSLYDSLMPVNSSVCTVEPGHEADPVQLTDGYIRFVSTDGTFPVVDGHIIGEAFVRPGRDDLQLGYLTTINWTADAKILEAGWIKLRREQAKTN